MPKKPRSVIEYRLYDLPPQLPILCLTGEKWRISDTLSGHLHFHNCLEIGLCHTDSGFMLMESERVPFAAGDLMLVPRHLPHTTCSDPGCRSRWSYLYIDLEQMLSFFRGTMTGLPSDRLLRYFETWHTVRAGEETRLVQIVRMLIDACVPEQAAEPQLIRAYSLVLALELERLASSEPFS